MRTIYNMSGRVVSDVQTQGEGEIKVKVYANQGKSVSLLQTPSCS